MEERVFNRIAVMRADRKVSRRELAEALGVHYQTVGYVIASGAQDRQVLRGSRGVSFLPR